MRVVRTAICTVGAGLLALAAPCAAFGQSASAKTRAVEIDAGVLVGGGGSLGSDSARLATGGNGAPLILFTTSYSTGVSAGVEVRASARVAPRVRAEVSGSWARADLRSQLGGDFEDAVPATAVLSASRFTLEGAAEWEIARHGKLQPFVRGGAGWLRSVTADQVLKGDGLIATGGAGVKYWWHERDRGVVRRWGIRTEVRLVSRPTALPFGSGRRLLAPAAVAGAMLGF